MATILNAVIYILLAISAFATAWYLARRSQAREHKAHLEAERSRAELERATLAERLIAREQDIERLQAELREQNEKNDRVSQERDSAISQLTELKARSVAEEKALQEKIKILQNAEVELQSRFKATAAEALKSNNQSFLQLAKESLNTFQKDAQGDLSKRQEAIEHLVKPLRETLSKVETRIESTEKQRSSAFAGLNEQIKQLLDAQGALRSETGNLIKALRAPQVRGRWGEMQLRRTVEMAGMVAYCDFQEQVSQTNEDGKAQRPDMIVRLPNGRNIVVDAKAPLAAYLESLETESLEMQKLALQQHAKQVKDHLRMLGTKAYSDQFKPSPEFVVLFLPGETFFSAALEQDPELIEFGVNQKVILATPTTLIALLKAVAYGWQQEEVAKEARRIHDLGKEIYQRVGKVANDFDKVRRGLNQAVGGYNDAVKSFDSRLMVTARKLNEMESLPGKELTQLDELDSSAIPFRSDELTPHTDTSKES
ncbi:MAG: DNA recombination protein RmuC [Opitutales bacterium]